MPVETFRWFVAGGVIIATLCIIAMAVTLILAFRILTELRVKVTDVVNRALPVIHSIGQLVDSNSPKIGDITSSVQETAANARDISVIAKDQAHRFAEVGRDAADRAKLQIARVDAAVDDTVDQVQNLGSNVRTAVLKPVSEVSGLFAGIRAGVSAFAQGQRPNVARATQDEEMFI